jgi:hypothetical protein
MLEAEVAQYLCAAVQALLAGEQVSPDGKLRLPASTLDSADGLAVQVDTDSEPGTIVFSLVAYDG